MIYTTTTSTSISSAAAAVLEAECCPSVIVSPTLPAASSPPRPLPANLSPCAACKTLRRRCAEGCVLAPYFPPTDPLKFAVAHRIFGASNIVKLLQELPEAQRTDAVNSMVYEANARLRDPIYGCAGTISHLLNYIDKLQVELARAHAEILNMRSQNATLLDLFYIEIMSTQDVAENVGRDELPYHHQNPTTFFEEEFMEEPLWI